MPETAFPRGVRDLRPNESIFRNDFLKKTETLFQTFGFYPIETPMIEHLSVLKAKGAIGEDSKLIYEIKDEELGLRYDHTVSLARFAAMHRDIPLPIKRYAIGKVWRKDEPQRLRYRELTLADIDIIGGKSICSDAEVIATSAAVLDSINFEYSIYLNDRRIVEAVFLEFGVDKEKLVNIERAIDKLEKIGKQKVAEIISSMGIEKSICDQIMDFVATEGDNDAKIQVANNLLKDKNPLEEFVNLLNTLKVYNLKGNIVINFSLMRGLDYYTSTVFEFKHAGESSSIAGGGRYDHLIALYGGTQTSAVGSSLGIDRILEMMNFSSSAQQTYSKAFVVVIKESNYNYALGVANILRSNGICCDINLSSKNLSNQLSYANALKIKYVLIIGDQEEKSNKIKLRNLINGEEVMLSVEETINAIRG